MHYTMVALTCMVLAGTLLSPTPARAQELQTHPRILAGYTGAFRDDERERWREYLPLLAEHGFNVVEYKIHPRGFDPEDATMRDFVHTVANAVEEAGLEFYIYLYEYRTERDPADHAHLPAFMSTDGTINEAMYCLYEPRAWLELFDRAFWVAERSNEVAIAGVKIDVENLQNYRLCVCDQCFSDFARVCGAEGVQVAPAERWAWVREHSDADTYTAFLESRIDDAVQQFRERAHAINPDLRLGMMPVRDTHFHRPWIRHLATERAPAVMDSWAMYGGLGWTESVAEERDFVKSLNPHNLFVPWFRPNNYRPEEMGEHAFVAAVEADGYNIWQLNMMHPEQFAARSPSYALPTDYQDPMAYWQAMGEANERVRGWLEAPHEIAYEPIEMLIERADIGGVTIPDLRPVTPDAAALDEEPSETVLRGVNRIMIHVSDPADPIEAQIRHVAGTSRPRAIAWALAKGPDQPVIEGRVEAGETAELSMTVPEAGVYVLVVHAQEGGGPWYSVRVHSHPHGVDASRKAYYFRRAPRQYFWVPEGLESFRVYGETGPRNQQMWVRVWQPDGTEALDHTINSDVAHRETLEIAVPAGTSGAVWSMEIGRPEEMVPTHYSENYWLRVMDASPYLAERPSAVLGERQ